MFCWLEAPSPWSSGVARASGPLRNRHRRNGQGRNRRAPNPLSRCDKAPEDERDVLKLLSYRRMAHRSHSRSCGQESKLELSSFRGRADQQASRDSIESGALSFFVGPPITTDETRHNSSFLQQPRPRKIRAMLADTPFDGQTANACLRHFSTPVIGCCLLVFPREERAAAPPAQRCQF